MCISGQSAKTHEMFSGLLMIYCSFKHRQELCLAIIFARIRKRFAKCLRWHQKHFSSVIKITPTHGIDITPQEQTAGLTSRSARVQKPFQATFSSSRLSDLN